VFAHITSVISKREELTMSVEKVLYTAKVHTMGGRQGLSQSSDGRLNIDLSPPGVTGGGTNPEQLFAAGWSACFIGAMKLAATRMKVILPGDTAIDAEVDLGTDASGFLLRARLNVSLPGVGREQALALVDAAHHNCPYSKATRGNVDVTINLV
jgi:lipoyl-dependent peroxiredoxin